MKKNLILTFLLITTLITACSPGSSGTPAQEPTADVAVIRTSAASTVISQFTLTAAAFTPTPQTQSTTQPTETSATSATQTTPQTTNPAATQPGVQVTNAQGTTVALCDSLSFVADVTVPDDTSMSPGQDFLKTWRVKNSGSCPWGSGYKLVYAGYADKMNGQFQPLNGVIQPGQEVEISVQFKAPDAADQYLSAWQMSNPAGVTFPQIIFVKIIVQ
jgi:Ig-like domain-containing protein